MRHPAATAGPRALVVTPRDARADLPSFAPTPPVDGCTPSTIFSAASDYADDVADRATLTRRRITLRAERSLYAALPLSVKKVQAIERLRGADRIGEHFLAARGSPRRRGRRGAALPSLVGAL